MKHQIRNTFAAALLALAGAAQADINIGVNLSLTGPLSSLGLPVKSSLDLWPERIAGEKIKLIVLDDGSDTIGAVKNTRRFITESKVDVLLGSSGVPAVLAMAPVATETHTVQLALAPAPRPGGKDDWTFPLPQPVSLMSDAVAKRMLADKVKKVAFLGWNEGYGEMWLQAFTASAKKAGLEVIATERFAPPDTAITSQALRVIAAKPDAVLIVGAGSAAAMPQINLRERGWSGPIYQTHGAGGWQGHEWRDFAGRAGAGSRTIGGQQPDQTRGHRVCECFRESARGQLAHPVWRSRQRRAQGAATHRAAGAEKSQARHTRIPPGAARCAGERKRHRHLAWRTQLHAHRPHWL